MSAAIRSAAGKRTGRAAQAHPRQPSARNVEVYGRVRQCGQRQDLVAAELGLSQSRVSRICSQVEAWRRWCDARPGQEASEDERRAMREQVRRRNEQILALAVKGLAQHPLDRQLLKLTMRALETLHSLEEGLPPLARFAASPEGREVGEVLRGLLAQLQGTARTPSETSETGETGETGENSAAAGAAPGGAENHHMPHFMQANAAHSAPARGAAPALVSRTAGASCGQLDGRGGTDYAP